MTPEMSGPEEPISAERDLQATGLSSDVTQLLLAWSEGDREALGQLMPLVCEELRLMARNSLQRERPGHVLQPTALVHEFFLRIHRRRTVSWSNSAQFFGYAAQTMRLILVDHARRQRRLKRGGDQEEVAWDLERLALPEPSFKVIAVHQVLDRLEAVDPRAAEVVKLRFFVGMSVRETAAALDSSPATVKRDWQFAKLWLFRELSTAK